MPDFEFGAHASRPRRALPFLIAVAQEIMVARTWSLVN